MTTIKQKLANQYNAQRSSGPKTDEGKRKSAINATRHGLTMSIEDSAWQPFLNQIKNLLVEDGYDKASARNLALYILDFERNVEYLMKICEKSKVSAYVKGVNFETAKENSFKNLNLDNRKIHELQLKNYKEFKSADRYFRRAANQLLKRCRLDS